MKRIVIMLLFVVFFGVSSFAQSGGPGPCIDCHGGQTPSKPKQASATKYSRNWVPATVTGIIFADDKKIVPRSHMEPLHIPLTVIFYHFETGGMAYTVRQVIKKNGTPPSITLYGTDKGNW